MGKQFSCLQIIKSNQVKPPQKTLHKRSRCKQTIPPPPPRRKSPIDHTINRPTPPPPPSHTNLHHNLHTYHDITQTQSTNPTLQISHKNKTPPKNTLTIPSSNKNNLKSQRDPSNTMTPTITNISALSSAVSIISTLSNAPSSTIYTDNINNTNYSSSETSLSIITTDNDTSVSSTHSNNAPSSPISPSGSDNSSNLIPTHTATTTDIAMEQTVHYTNAKTLSYDGDIEPETDEDTMDNTVTTVTVTATVTGTDSCTKYENDNSTVTKCSNGSESSDTAQTFIVYNGDENEDNISENINDIYSINGSNVSNVSNISNEFLSLSNIKLPNNNLSVTTQLSQLLNEQCVRIVTLTQTMDIKEIYSNSHIPPIPPNRNMLSVKSTSVAPAPVIIDDDVINNTFDNQFYEIHGTKVDVNQIEKCLEMNENNQEYVD